MAKFQNPRWESVPACLVWPDIDYEESLQRSHQKQTNETGETAVKRLRVRAINPHNSLKVAYTVNRNGDKMITREEMKRVVNFSMPYPAKLSAKDYKELLLILDPLHTNLIKLEDFLNLFKPESVCDLENSIKKVSTSSLQRHEPLTLLKLDEKIRYSIKTQTEKLLKAFTFYDFENTGMVSKQHVKYLLQKHCMPLSDKQFERLWKIFPVENGALNYIRFLEDFGDCKPNDSMSNYRIKTISRTLVCSSSKSKYEPSIQKLRNASECHCEIEGKQFNDIKIILRNCIEKNWHDIIRKCKEADPRQSGRIASESMKEVLNQCGIPVYSEFMNNFLERQYNMVPGTLMNYWQFIKNISNNSYHRSQYECYNSNKSDQVEMQIYRKEKPDYLTIPEEAAWSTLPAPPNYDLLLKKLIDCSWRKIIYKCRTMDVKESGNISCEKFMTILANCGIPVTNRNLSRILQEIYSIIPGKKVNYWMFLRKCSLDKPDNAITKPNCDHVYRILLRMRSQILFYFGALRQQFLANDPQKAGLIDATKFKKILNDFAICLSDEDFFIICKHFDPVLSGSIPYVNFLQSFAHPNF
ncbi:EF-hand calcium-binding domain-containing protein 6-like [Centruroides sculpturatus]|uniref:EF-hand calcium-binding domain-containing protein 6-like n=1 Tax=Centruroides sculpturatus TaxID=218467 RepID=UPI000C6E1D48|nr:EF-hand calcium-binding domain-containing protein 6-like [Centruroides sculpturatus]